MSQMVSKQSSHDLDQLRTTLRYCLEKTDKGTTANTIQNCTLVFDCDPLFSGKIMRNLLTATDDMIGGLTPCAAAL